MSVLVDSNIWIYANIEEYPEHRLAISKIKESEKEGIVLNDIVFSEVFHKLSILLKSKSGAKLRVEKILDSDYIVFVPIEKFTVKKALEISVLNDLRINDSLIAQHCLENNFRLLTGNTKDFSRIKGLEIISLRG